MSPEDLVDSSIYVEYVPDYDEGIDGETYQCGDIEYWKTTEQRYLFDLCRRSRRRRCRWCRSRRDEVIEYTINWLKSEENWETLAVKNVLDTEKKNTTMDAQKDVE